MLAGVLESMPSQIGRESAELLHRDLSGKGAEVWQALCMLAAHVPALQRRAQPLCTCPAAAILNRGVGRRASAHGPPCWEVEAAILQEELWSEAQV